MRIASVRSSLPTRPIFTFKSFFGSIPIHLTNIKTLEYDFSKEVKTGDVLINIISDARGEKTNNNVSLKTPIKNLDISVNGDVKNAINESIKDFKATLFIENLVLNDSDIEYQINNIELNLNDIENN